MHSIAPKINPLNYLESSPFQMQMSELEFNQELYCNLSKQNLIVYHTTIPMKYITNFVMVEKS